MAQDPTLFMVRSFDRSDHIAYMLILSDRKMVNLMKAKTATSLNRIIGRCGRVGGLFFPFNLRYTLREGAKCPVDVCYTPTEAE